MENTKIEVAGIELVLQFDKENNCVDIVKGDVRNVLNNISGSVDGVVSGNVGAVFGDIKNSVGGDIGGDVDGSIRGSVCDVGGNIDNDVGGNIGGSIGGNVNGDIMGYLRGVVQTATPVEAGTPAYVVGSLDDGIDIDGLGSVITELEEKLAKLRKISLEKRLKEATIAAVKKLTDKELKEFLKKAPRAKLRTPVA